MAGIILLSLQFNIRIGAATIDIFSDPIAFILIIFACKDLVPRNIMFKKSRNRAIMGLIATCIGQAINLFSWGDSTEQVNAIAIGLSVVFTIYFTYHFTEALILEAKFQDKSASTRSLRLIWMIMCAMIFVHFMVFKATISTPAILVEALVGICTIYFTSSVLTACKSLYMEGLPTKHMI